MQQTVLILVDLDHVADNDTARSKVTFAPRLVSVETECTTFLSSAIFQPQSSWLCTRRTISMDPENTVFNKAVILSSFPYLCVNLPSSDLKGIRKICNLHLHAISNNHKQS